MRWECIHRAWTVVARPVRFRIKGLGRLLVRALVLLDLADQQYPAAAGRPRVVSEVVPSVHPPWVCVVGVGSDWVVEVEVEVGCSSRMEVS